MRKGIYGTRYTTGCGHNYYRRYKRFTVATLAGCTTDCPVCGELLIIDAGQFAGKRLDVKPFAVHLPLFHRYLHQQDPRWPADGAGTGYIEFEVNE